jgi:hypothetical protein
VFVLAECGNKLGWTAVTGLRLLESAVYPGEDISGLEEERWLLGNDTVVIGLMRWKRRKTFVSPHGGVSHKTRHFTGDAVSTTCVEMWMGR